MEKCFKCEKEIDLVESYYNDGMCKDCWYDYEYFQDENEIKGEIKQCKS